MTRPKAKRPVDHWREWASKPLVAFRIAQSAPTTRADPATMQCTLEQDGKVIGQWQNGDAPWLTEEERALLRDKLPKRWQDRTGAGNAQ